jgi:oxygen-independent coproporphyrinogen-3 oxidase
VARVPYLGLGPAAHSFDGDRRWWNPREVGPWLDAIEAGRDPAEAVETLSDADARLERLMLGLRTREGTARADVGDAAALERFAEGAFVVVAGERVQPTVRGMLVADRMAAELS